MTRRLPAWALSPLLVCLCATGSIGLNLVGDTGVLAAMGKGLFKRNWVPAPSSTKSNDGLGPLFNARSCAQCHAAASSGRLDVSPSGLLGERGGVVRLSTRSGEGDPTYGAQVQTNAIAGHQPEAMVRIAWATSTVRLPDGEVVELRKPEVDLHELGYGRMAQGTSVSLVLAPSLAIAAQIARVGPLRADPAAGDSDGIGNFGRKRTQLSLEDATAMAFSRDLGLSTRQHQAPGGDCTTPQSKCLSGPHGQEGDGVEMAPEIVTAITAYLTTLPSPAAPASGQVEGRAAFVDAGCDSCHRPTLAGRRGEDVVLFSDLKLHDMGAALVGPIEKGGVAATQWRTAPLLGVAERLAAGSTLLHDGRARSVREAVLWHGGDAQSARVAYENLPAAKRAALEDYVLGR